MTSEHFPRYQAASWLPDRLLPSSHIAEFQLPPPFKLASTPPKDSPTSADHRLQHTMTDSPLPRIPLDPKEQPILDRLQSIRTELELLKRDRSTYVKSQDVLKLYDQVIEQVIILNEIRETKRLEQNKGMSRCHLPDVGC